MAPKDTKRYRTLRSFLDERFHFPVRTVFADTEEGPPTGEGAPQSSGCLYCYSRGPRMALHEESVTVTDQVKEGLGRVRRHHPSARAIASFRPSSNAPEPIDVLQRRYREALGVDGVVGISVSIRPECLTEETLRLLEGIAKTHEVWLEMGPQTVHDEHLVITEGSQISHAWSEAVEKAAGRGLHQVAHPILGLPGEGTQEALQAINAIASLPIDGVKLHHLMVFEETELADLWRRRHFTLIAAEAYVDLVVAVLEHLPPEVVIHRLVAEPPSWERLLAPRWRQSSDELLVAIDAELARHGTRQGARFTHH